MSSSSSTSYNYEGKMWKSSPTQQGIDSFFHAAFGIQKEGFYVDILAEFRRSQWHAFLVFCKTRTLPKRLQQVLGKFLHEQCQSPSYTTDDFDRYIHYVRSGVDIKMEEIPILATLWNKSITVVSTTDTNAVDVTVFLPEPIILERFPFTNNETEDKVVISMEGNNFQRLDPIIERLISNTVEVNQTINEQTLVNVIRYRKGGNAGSKGVQFQVNILLVLILNAFAKLKKWRLSTEYEKAGKFDDAVLEWPDEAVLLQAKHKDDANKMINLEQFLPSDSKSARTGNFSLSKYFVSYLKDIKQNFCAATNLIICTNANLDDIVLSFLELQSKISNSLLHYKNAKFSIYCFKDDIAPRLKQNIIQNCKDIDKSEVTDANIKDFLRKLQICSNYTSEGYLEKGIENLLSYIKYSSYSNRQITYTEIFAKVMIWFQQKRGVYLEHLGTLAIFFEIWRDYYFQIMQKYHIQWNNNVLNFKNLEGISHIKGSHLLQQIRLCGELKTSQNKILCLTFDEDIKTQMEIIRAFKLPQYSYLLMISLKTSDHSILRKISEKLRKIINEFEWKGIISLTDENSELVKYIKLLPRYQTIDFPATLEHVSPVSRDELLKRKSLLFQGDRVCLKELFYPQTAEFYVKNLNSTIMDLILGEEEVRVGSKIPTLEEKLAACYVNREIYRNEETFPEEKIGNINDKVIIISDMAGNGKTTLLTSLALIIKKEFSFLWVITVHANEYSKEFKHLLSENRETVDIFELLQLKYNFNELEKLVSSTSEKIVLLFDAVDEVTPDYTDIVLNLLKQCKEDPKIQKLFVTTRPHISRKLEKVLGVHSFKLLPFTEENKINFLFNYWSYNLKLCREQYCRCKIYARALINKMNIFNTSYYHESFMIIPLLLRMSAEIFQDINQIGDPHNWQSCQEFINADNEVPNLIDVNVFQLYDMFVENKRDIFMSKVNPSASTGANESLHKQFEECLNSLKNFALEVMLDKSECKLLRTYQRFNKTSGENLVKIGIIQKIDNEFHFIHKTFSEYFVAKSLVMEFQKLNKNKKFLQFFIDRVLQLYRYNAVVVFIENILESLKPSLPNNIFNNYQNIWFGNSINRHFIHVLAKEGRVRILELILNCIDFAPTTDKQAFVDNRVPIYIPRNTLYFLKFLLHKGGLNIKDETSRTPLHYAVERGHLRMVKFLYQRGANFKIKNIHGLTALQEAVNRNYTNIVHYFLETCLEVDGMCAENYYAAYAAAYLGRQDILKQMVEKGMDVNKRVDGSYLIFAAVFGRRKDTIKYLILQGGNLKNEDSKGYTLLHVAVFATRLHGMSFLNIIKFLILQCDMNVNIQNSYGRTPLHTAVDSVWPYVGFSSNSLHLIKSLVLEYGANVNIQDSYGYTPLNIAITSGHLSIIKRFIQEYGADPYIRDIKGQTSLHQVTSNWLYSNSRLDIIKFFFLECGANVNIQDNDGLTPLHLAVGNNHLDVINYLIEECRADVNIPDNQGRTPLDLIETREAKEVTIEILKYKKYKKQ